ncbi:hypothetical protein QE152_g3531 [Popillia japonica]|uniref:Uncharacterized protein n=1 Tax=Popillia japonica TaxID=7064 RepID=A0AAW1N4K3_POPJA
MGSSNKKYNSKLLRQIGITHSINCENARDNLEKSGNEDDLPLSLLAEILRNKEKFGIENDNEIEDFFNVDNNLMFEETDDCMSGVPYTRDSVG